MFAPISILNQQIIIVRYPHKIRESLHLNYCRYLVLSLEYYYRVAKESKVLYTLNLCLILISASSFLHTLFSFEPILSLDFSHTIIFCCNLIKSVTRVEMVSFSLIGIAPTVPPTLFTTWKVECLLLLVVIQLSTPLNPTSLAEIGEFS